ncbi:MAG: tetratricopeptide repeat protein [Sphingobacteriaceae bacterium]
MINKILHKYFLLFVIIGISIASCEHSTDQAKTEVIPSFPDSTYYNHHDSAKYVGMNTCKQCHQSIYNSFIKTGMGKSFNIATKQKSIAYFENASIYDKFINMHYKAFFEKDSMFIQEFRLEKNDTTYKRTEQVNYIIGSGQHTNSHIQSVNGYLNQMPMTFYSQKQKWDLPPGFENGVNTRFTRKIGLECMSCHNGYPNFVMGSENKYNYVPDGIDCERCHGPGSIHVHLKQTGKLVDTSKHIDYSIVNPSKLPIDLQFDVCQRCHLQGNAVLKNDHSFYDFKPGKKLNDYISVFLPKYKNADDEFIMASHADRLKQSACFIKSFERSGNTKSLKPYKSAMTCITCHNPHVSVRETNKEVFNDACRNCHGSANTKQPSEKCKKPSYNTSNCVSCHMPSSGSIDIPHVSVHDHYIRKPISKKEKNKIKEFIGLYAVNEPKPSTQTKARAYIQQYEKFEQKASYLDSAAFYLSDKTSEDLERNIHDLIKLQFMKQNYLQIITYVNKLVEDHLYQDKLRQISFDNRDAWTSYHIAEAYYNTGNINKAVKWFSKACELANYNLEFKNKFGSALAQSGMTNKAKQQFELVLKENPKNVQAYTNLGYISLLEGDQKKAFMLYNQGLKIDPDNENLLMNLAGYYAASKNKIMALEILNKIINKNPKNQQAKLALKQIQMLN